MPFSGGILTPTEADFVKLCTPRHLADSGRILTGEWHGKLAAFAVHCLGNEAFLLDSSNASFPASDSAVDISDALRRRARALCMSIDDEDADGDCGDTSHMCTHEGERLQCPLASDARVAARCTGRR